MATWLLSVAGVSNSLSGWGINADSVLRSLKSFETGLVSFTMISDQIVGEPAFVDRSEAILTKDGVRIFVGEIYEDGTELSAFTQLQKYVIKDRWAQLETCAYAQNKTVKTSDFSDYTLGRTTNTVLYARTSILLVEKITTKNQMEDLLAFAVTDGVKIAYNVDFDGLTPPYQQAKGLTVAGAMRLVVGVIADMFTYWDYATTPYPTLYVRRKASVTPTMIDLTEYSKTVGLVSVKPLKPLPELFVDSVEVNIETSEVNPADNIRYARLAQQFEGIARPGGRNLRASFGLAGQGTPDPEATPAALASAYYAALHFLYYQTTLLFNHAECPFTYRPGAVFNFNGTVNGVAVRAAWATAGAIAQVVNEQLFRGITEVQCGVPPAMNTATFRELQQKLAAVAAPNVGGYTSGISADGPDSSSQGYRVKFISCSWLKSDTSNGFGLSMIIDSEVLIPGATSKVLRAGTYPIVISFYLFGSRNGFTTLGPLVIGPSPSSSPMLYAFANDFLADGTYSGELHFTVSS